MRFPFAPTAVNCPLPRQPQGGRIVHDKPVTGNTVMYGQGWTYECPSPKAPSQERGSCRADGSVPEPPVCRGTQRRGHQCLPSSLSISLSHMMSPCLWSPQTSAAPFQQISQMASSPLPWWGHTDTRRRWNTAAMSTTFWMVRLRYSAKTQGTGPPSRRAEVSGGKVSPQKLSSG